MIAAKTISFSIYKGGTGKTTSAINTADALSNLGKRVLLVDLDQQASATKYSGLTPEKLKYNLYHVFYQNVPASVVRQGTAFGFDVLPSSGLMAAIEESLEEGDEAILRERLNSVRDEYDFILIDPPPGKGGLAFNAIVASDFLLVACGAERMEVDGISDLVNHVQEVIWHQYREELNDQEVRILFTKYKANTNHSPGVVKAAKRIYRDTVLDFFIPATIEFPRSYDKQIPLTTLNQNHAGSKSYYKLARWLIHDAKTATRKV